MTPAKVNPRNLSPCKVRAGGSNVRIAGVSCDEISDAIRYWAHAPVYYNQDRSSSAPATGPQERVFEQPGGWTCYGRLHKGLQIIRNVCFRGSAVVVYTVS
jgi:hypothetical protein